jgi:polyisoprenoid-binding protein YceI
MTMMRKLISGGALALATMTIAAGPAPMKWNVDVPHTGIEFSVNHFFTPVTGKFDNYEIDLTFDRENPANSEVAVRIDVNSVNTGNERRDTHLLSGDFFEADQYGYITFESESVRANGENQLLARGPLTIKGVTHQVELPITILGVKDIPAEMREMLGGGRHQHRRGGESVGSHQSHSVSIRRSGWRPVPREGCGPPVASRARWGGSLPPA